MFQLKFRLKAFVTCSLLRVKNHLNVAFKQSNLQNFVTSIGK